MNTEIIKLKSDIEDVLDAFQLNRNIGCELLDIWLSKEHQLTENEISVLERKRFSLQQEGDFWNEEELKMRFLAFLFDIANLDEPNKIKLFFERPLSAIIGKYELGVICDAMMATPRGVGKPQQPFFFLQEFKKQKNADDAEGQMLTAMLIAQAKNESKIPIYGCWIQGRYWIFSVLNNQDYCVSKSFDATEKEDLLSIIYALKELKTLVLNQLENISS